ncbi:hypothetical protein Barb4_03222 [Bacteroidales bacterium Barb4]|nr:hypothetical protein Barb4_03222 [Bacteroidales bacterium Barb4]
MSSSAKLDTKSAKAVVLSFRLNLPCFFLTVKDS